MLDQLHDARALAWSKPESRKQMTVQLAINRAMRRSEEYRQTDSYAKQVAGGIKGTKKLTALAEDKWALLMGSKGVEQLRLRVLFDDPFIRSCAKRTLNAIMKHDRQGHSIRRRTYLSDLVKRGVIRFRKTRDRRDRDGVKWVVDSETSAAVDDEPSDAVDSGPSKAADSERVQMVGSGYSNAYTGPILRL